MTSGLLMIAVLSGCDGSASANPGAGDNNQEYSYEWIPETVSGERYYSLGDEYTISVLPSTGEFIFSLTLSNVVGINKVLPDLKLDYSNQNFSFSSLGMGFKIDGINVIEKCQSDSYCLNDLPLVLVSREIGKEYYRTNPDQNSVVIAHVNNREIVQWEISTSDGKRLEFGSDESSRLIDINTGETLKWYIAQVSDPMQNTMVFEYRLQDSPSIYKEIKTIKYYNIDDVYKASLYFEYTDSDVVFDGSNINSKDSPKSLLTKISSSLQGESVKSYKFIYGLSPINDIPTLNTITECNEDICKNPYVISWLDMDDKVFISGLDVPNNRKASISYSKLSRYFPFPFSDYKSVYCVESIDDLSKDNNSSMRYTYEGEISRLSGGYFSKTIMTDDRLNRSVSYLIHATDKYAGYVYNIQTNVAGRMINEVSSNWGSKLSDAGIPFIYLSDNTINEFDVHGTLIKTTTRQHTVDNYNNITYLKQSIKDRVGNIKHQKVINSTYANPYEYNVWMPNLKLYERTRSSSDGASVSNVVSFEYEYNTALLKTKTVEPDNVNNDANNYYLKSSYKYNKYGLIIEKLTAGSDSAIHPIEKRSVSSEYDFSNPKAPIVIVSNESGEKTTYTLNAKNGKKTQTIDANGTETNFTYDKFGNLEEIIYDDGTFTSDTYYLCSSDVCLDNEEFYRAEIISARPVVKTFFDKFGRKVRTETRILNNEKISKRWVYNDQGLITSESNKYVENNYPEWKYFEYDGHNQVTREVRPDGSEINYSYNGLRTVRRELRIGVNGNALLTSIVEKNVIGKVAKLTNDNNKSTSYYYSPLNKLTRIVDSQGNSIINTYDSLGRKIRSVEPNSGVKLYEYDSLGNVRKITDSKSQVISIKYDLESRKTYQHNSSTNDTDYWVYYSSNNNVPDGYIGKLKTTFRNNQYASAKSFKYNRVGKVVELQSIIDSEEYNTKFTYNKYSQLSIIQYPAYDNGSALSVQHTYDQNGIFNAVTSLDLSNIYWKANETNADGKITSEEFNSGRVHTTKTYDKKTGLLSAIKSSNTSGNGNVQNNYYGFDSMGNLEYREDLNSSFGISGQMERFTYDSLNRLTGNQVNGATYEYSYDDIGNIIYKTGVGVYAYDKSKPHAVASVAGRQLQYDNNGNMIKSNKDTIIKYDGYNKVSEISNVDGLKLNFYHNSQNNRYKKTENNNGAITTTRYISRFSDVVSKQDSKVFRNYIFAGKRLVVIVRKTPAINHEASYIHTDHLGSISVVTNSAGQIKEKYSYDAFGKRRSIVNSENQETDNVFSKLNVNHGYTGHEHLVTDNFIHMNGRVYDPTLGRFLSADPVLDITNMQSLNKYSYVSNNPLSAYDPTGYWPLSIWGKKILYVVGNTLYTAFGGGVFGAAVATSILVAGGTAVTAVTFSALLPAITLGVVTGAVLAFSASILHVYSPKGSDGYELGRTTTRFINVSTSMLLSAGANYLLGGGPLLASLGLYATGKFSDYIANESVKYGDSTFDDGHGMLGIYSDSETSYLSTQKHGTKENVVAVNQKDINTLPQPYTDASKLLDVTTLCEDSHELNLCNSM